MNTLKRNDIPKARILEIQRMSTEDGPGIRTTVFFKGCSLRCVWCHNPESISPKPQVQWIGSRCIGCRTCIEVCRSGALSLEQNGMTIDRSKCIGCGTCAEECPSTAMELLGKEWTLDDLTHEVIKDKAYFEKSGGGVTVSGGEPGVQAQFVGKFLKSLRERGVHTALDTCGLCSGEAFDLLLPYSSMVLYDLKEIDPVKHQKFTGETNDKIFRNLIYLSEYMRSHVYPAALWIRTPIIPELTAEVKNISGIGRFIAENLKGVVDRWELCAFNNLCRDKYTRLGREWMLKDSPLLTKDFMETLAEAARRSGVSPAIVCWSGSTRMEENPLPDRERACE